MCHLSLLRVNASSKHHTIHPNDNRAFISNLRVEVCSCFINKSLSTVLSYDNTAAFVPS